jgi:hypothetical protein
VMEMTSSASWGVTLIGSAIVAFSFTVTEVAVPQCRPL